ncbi:MAG: hypothetical protein ACKN94_02190, partial [Pirellulaceae bacterium]
FPRGSAAQMATLGATATRTSSDQLAIALSLHLPAPPETMNDGKPIAEIDLGSDHPTLEKEIR